LTNATLRNNNKDTGQRGATLEKYLTAKQMADKLQVNRTTLWRWEKNGTLKPLKIGGVKRYSQDQLDKDK
jgi:predicted DNA-binding transcriptional regulator AlpA